MRLRLFASSVTLLTLVAATAAQAADPTATATPTASPTIGPTATPTGTPTQQPDSEAADGVLAISIDGLNPNALKRLGRAGTPHLHRLISQGASTLNARTEYELTITLPNHTGMVTGRRIEAATGGHGVTWNDDRMTPNTVQEAAGSAVTSVFNQVHDAGGSTALFASKTKFSLWQRSWPEAIDQVTINEDNPALVSALRADLASSTRDFRFLHLSLPDKVGHARGFMSRPYLAAVRRTDRLVGQAVRAADAAAEGGRSTVIVTSDHGGLGASHANRFKVANYRVMFAVRGPGVDAGADLYKLNPAYANPGNRRIGYAKPRQPVRNGALANLALDLLDVSPVPGSEHNVDQDLEVTKVP